MFLNCKETVGVRAEKEVMKGVWRAKRRAEGPERAEGNLRAGSRNGARAGLRAQAGLVGASGPFPGRSFQLLNFRDPGSAAPLRRASLLGSFQLSAAKGCFLFPRIPFRGAGWRELSFFCPAGRRAGGFCCSGLSVLPGGRSLSWISDMFLCNVSTVCRTRFSFRLL